MTRQSPQNSWKESPVTEPTPASPEHVEPTVTDGLTVPAMPVQRTGSESHDLWSREAQTVGETQSFDPASTIEVATALGTADGALSDVDSAAAEGRPKRRRRTPIILSVSAVLVLLAGYGAYAGARLWTGAGIREPENAVPASVSVFFRVDLKPGYRDQLAFDKLVKKFPTGKSTQDLLTGTETKVAKSAGLNFDTDVKPWFAGQAGVAEWTNAGGQPVLVLAFASSDDAKAKAALAKVKAKEANGDDFGYVVSNGYAIITGESSGAQADATAVASEATAHSLAGSAKYKSALSHVSGNNLVIGYVDVSKFAQMLVPQLQGLMSGGLGGVNPLGGSDPLGGDNPLGGGTMLPGLMGLSAGSMTDALAKLTGTIVVGASVVGDGVEIREHADGLSSGTGTAAGTNVVSTMKAMPGNTIAGVALDGADPNGAAAKSLTQQLGSLSGLMGSGGDGSEMAGAMQVLSGPIQSILTAKVISLAVTGISGGKPNGELSVDFRDAASAQSIMAAVQSLTGNGPLPGITITQSGNAVKAAMGSSAGGGKLGGNALFNEATQGMSNAYEMAYIDVQKLLAQTSTSSSADKEIAPIKAVAFAGSSSGSSSDVLIRVIIK
jgi:hypothetical protein